MSSIFYVKYSIYPYPIINLSCFLGGINKWFTLSLSRSMVNNTHILLGIAQKKTESGSGGGGLTHYATYHQVPKHSDKKIE